MPIAGCCYMRGARERVRMSQNRTPVAYQATFMFLTGEVLIRNNFAVYPILFSHVDSDNENNVNNICWRHLPLAVKPMC